MFNKRKAMIRAGDHAPQFRLRSLDGSEVRSEDLYSGGPVVLAFFKVSCPVCQLTFPFLDRLRANGKFRILGVSQDDARATARFNQALGIHLETLLDEKADGYPASNGFGVTHVPSIFQVEEDGAVSFGWDGFSKADMEELGRRAGAAVFRPDDQVPAWKPG